jgi:Fe-S cluster biogenesis protein NfuA
LKNHLIGELSNYLINKLSNLKIMTTEELTSEVQKALEEIRPFLNSDGGDITLVSIEDGKHVKVRLEGACTSCSVNQMTLRAGVETTIKKFAPQIETVVNIA